MILPSVQGDCEIELLGGHCSYKSSVNLIIEMTCSIGKGSFASRAVDREGSVEGEEPGPHKQVILLACG